ncbi:MAG: hypothetical protein E6K91_05655 [Thaumarchaeota archaeon]|nr:MAG: hypothetical protein E6K91_05655 [Nitrososphaerota archaeon]
MSESKRLRIAYLTFLECEVRGGWLDEQTKSHFQIGKGEETHWRAWQEPAEILLIRQDGLKRHLYFRNGSLVIVHNGMIEFDQEDFLGEIMVDEDEREGKLLILN